MFILAEESLPGMRYFSADQVLGPYVTVFCVAYLVSFLFTPMMQSIAHYYRIIDEPDRLRKMHNVPVAYLGGVAVFLGWLSGLAFSQFQLMHGFIEGSPQTHVVINFSLIIGACIIVLLGLWDDILKMPPWVKIVGQVLAGGCVFWADIGRHSGWAILGPVFTRTSRVFGWPAASPDGFSGLYDHWVVGAVSLFFVIAIVVFCCNATNLLDGLDGLCGGVTGVISAGFLFLAVHLATQSGAVNLNQDALRVVLALALLGAVLGFVPFNFNPASIFMGDTGSMFLGFASATMMILLASEGHFRWFLASTVMFALPILDTTLAFVRRYIAGRPIFSADRHHLHHQLVARGFTVKQTVLISYGLSFLFCILGAAIVYIRTRYAIAVYLVVFGSLVVAAFKMGMVHERAKAVERKPLGSHGIETLPATVVEPNMVLEVNDTSTTGSKGSGSPAPEHVGAEWI